MFISDKFISRGCTTRPNCFVVTHTSSSEETYIAYASGSDVVVSNPDSAKVNQVLLGHTSEINCMSLVPDLENGYFSSLVDMQREIVSCDIDGFVVTWVLGSNGVWSVKQTFECGELIECLVCEALNDNELLLAICTDNRRVIYYHRSKDSTEWTEFYRMFSPTEDIYYTSVGCLPLISSTNSAIPDSLDILLFLAGTDRYLHLFSLSLPQFHISPVGSLSGFENWITSIRFHHSFIENTITHWHVLTSNQDGRCRIHKVMLCDSTEDKDTFSFSFSYNHYQITLETVIEVSSTTVSTIEPHPITHSSHSNYYSQSFLLLTSSFDGIIKIITPEDIQQGKGIFSAVITLQPHLIGSQGFYGCYWHLHSNQRSLIAYGYQGAMFHWTDSTPSSLLPSTLTLTPFLSSHQASTRVSFSHFGYLLLSSSLDRTVRLWGRELLSPHRWQEVSRPVVHGYPVTNVICMKDHSNQDNNVSSITNTEIGRIITINEEKKCRIYGNTIINLLILNELVHSADQMNQTQKTKIEDFPNSMFWSAFAPELGLSLKGIPIEQAKSTLCKYKYSIDAEEGSAGSLVIGDKDVGDGDDEEGGETGDAMLLMANDDVLQSVNNHGNNTLNESRLCKGLLFHETSFLFNRGNNNNFYLLSYDSSSDVVITGTIGTNVEESVLTVWDNCDSGNEGQLRLIQYLSGHRSTVTSTCFSWLGKQRIMLSVGKDRQLCFWRLKENRNFGLFCTLPKSHARVIWSCCVCFFEAVNIGEEEMAVFVTGSRDETVGIWGVNSDGKIQELSRFSCSASVTAVSCSSFAISTSTGLRTILAYGTEKGDLHFRYVDIENAVLIVRGEEEIVISLGKQINSIQWLPVEKKEGEKRSIEEYYGEESEGNVVVGCENSGIYLYKASI